MYVYIRTEGNYLFTVGFYSPDGKWEPESDHDTKESAAERAHWLNGGQVKTVQDDMRELYKGAGPARGD